jgi:hypothetical protein
MDQVVAQALTLYSHICGCNRAEAMAMRAEPKLTTISFASATANGNGYADAGNGNGDADGISHGASNGNGHASNGNGRPIRSTNGRCRTRSSRKPRVPLTVQERDVKVS